MKYLKFQGISTDKDLQTYPSVHLTSPQEWDPSVLDYVYPEDKGELDWNNDSSENFQFDPKFDGFDDYINKLLSITPKIPSIHNLLVNKHTTHWGVTFDFFPMKRKLEPRRQISTCFRWKNNLSTPQISAKAICILNWIHLYDEKQFTFLQEGSNRI